MVELFCLLIFLLKFLSKQETICKFARKVWTSKSTRCIAGHVWAFVKLRKTWKAGVYLEKKSMEYVYI